MEWVPLMDYSRVSLTSHTSHSGIFAADLAEILGIPTATEAATLTRALADPAQVHRIAESLVWFTGDCALKHAFVALVSGVARTSPNNVSAYLGGASDMTPLLERMIECSIPIRKTLKPDICLRDLAESDRSIDRVILDHLSRLSWRPTWRILGFGGYDCSYERHVGAKLISIGCGQECNIFRFDPGAQAEIGHVDNVNDIDPAISGSHGLEFDVIICRWVLHHVEESSRWGTLAACIRMLADAGAVVIVEEGDFAVTGCVTMEHRVLRFVTACQDVLVNGILRPKFVDGGQFYVKYLGAEDLEALESCMPTTVRRHMYLPRDSRAAGEAILIYS
jgi:hypothetical protein